MTSTEGRSRKIRRVSGGVRPDADGASESEAATEEEGGDAPDISGLVPPEVAARIQSLDRRFDDVLRRFKQVNDEAARAIGKSVQVADEVETLKSETLENMQVAFDENAEVLEAIEKDVTDLKSRVEGFDGHLIEQLDQVKIDLEDRIGEVEKSRGEFVADIDALKADAEMFRTGFADAKRAIDDRMPEIDRKITEGLSQVDARIREMRESLEQASEAARAKAEEAGAMARVELDEAAAALSASGHSGKTLAETLKSLATSQKSQSDALEGRLAELHDSVGGNVKSEIEQLGKRLDTELAAARDGAKKVEETLTAANGAIERSQEAVRQVDAVEERLKPLLERFEESARQLQTSRERIDVAMKLVDDVERKVAKLVAPIDDALEQLESFESFASQGELGFELHDLLQVMIKHNASDLHLKVGSPPTVRLDGELIPVGNDVLTDNDCKRLILGAISKSQRRQLLQSKDLDFAYAIPEARFRVNAFLSRGSVHSAFRLLRTEMPSIDSLHLPPVLKDLSLRHSGLVLVTGPAGSGKSTTLAAMIDHINATQKKHVITIEDPIEFLHKDKQSIITQRELGADTQSFQDGLRQALRQDPNVILIGEMRDAETIMTAAVAAETGHLVLSTLNTQNAVQAVDRMIDVFSGEQQRQFRMLLANTLRGVVSQRLLQRADSQGRVAAVEVMVATSTVTSLILEGKTNEIYPYIEQGTSEGMQTFTASLSRLLEQGLITKDEALYHADQPTELRLKVDGHTSGSAQYSEGDTLMNWL